MFMKKLLVASAAACLAQIAIAAGPGEPVGAGEFVKFLEQGAVVVNTQEAAKPITAFEPSVSTPVQLTDAEMDTVVAGWGYLHWPSNVPFEIKFRYMGHLGGDKVYGVISTPGACLVFNFSGGC